MPSKYCDFPQVGRHRPFERTGRAAGQDVHWLKAVPEHVAQSEWQEGQEPEEGKVVGGQDAVQVPLAVASRLEEQERQNVAEEAQVVHRESQADIRTTSIQFFFIFVTIMRKGKLTQTSEVVIGGNECSVRAALDTFAVG